MHVSPPGGVRKATLTLSGDSVYKHMKYEGGVHRVQRQPKTEKSGRMHTSTMSVAVLPQAEEVRGHTSTMSVAVLPQAEEVRGHTSLGGAHLSECGRAAPG